jgi:hypothetical protein
VILQSQTLLDNRVRSIFKDSHGTSLVQIKVDYIDRKQGYSISDDKRRTNKPPQALNEWDHITFITEDADKIWIASWQSGLTHYDPLTKQFNRYGINADKTRQLNVISMVCFCYPMAMFG